MAKWTTPLRAQRCNNAQLG